jgi:DAACS family dicarboxylate/amino acid:cation (Na+ or H+) symporter
VSRPFKMLAGFFLGAILGLLAYRFFSGVVWLELLTTYVLQPIGQIFLRIIFSAVVPLVFTSIVLGVYEMGDFKALGRISLKTLVYTIFASLASVGIGLALVSWLKPGVGFDASIVGGITALPQKEEIIANAGRAKPWIQSLVELIPRNPIEAATKALEGEMLSLMVFALIFGSALLSVRGGRSGDPLVRVMESLRDVSMKIVDFAMKLAPVAVGALTFSLCSRFGWGLLLSLGKYVLVVILGLSIQQFIVFGVLLAIFAKKSVWSFVIDIREVIVTAFSTASSNVTLPVSLRVAEQKLRLSKKVSSFVLTVGATANQNGTALFEGVTVLFLAQVFNVDLTASQQITVMLMSVMAGVGTAGVPGGSLPLIVLVLQSVGIPAEGIGIVLGVDRFLDMCRTVLNVSGDLVAATIIDASENSET